MFRAGAFKATRGSNMALSTTKRRSMPDTSVIGLQTQRLFLRQWHEGDLPPFVQLNADPRVMEFYPRPLTREESDETARKIQSLIASADGVYGRSS